MNKKLIMIVFVGLLSLILVACGGEEEKDTNKNEEEAKEVEATEKEDEGNDKDEEEEEYKETLEEAGDKTKDETGITELIKIKKPDEIIKNDPLEITINAIGVLKKTDVPRDFINEINMMAETDYEEGDEITYLQLDVDVENTGDLDVNWMGIDKLVTNNKNQIDGTGDEFLMDDEEDTLLEGTEKNVIYGYALDDSDTDEVRIIFDETNDEESFSEISGGVEYEFSFDDDDDGEVTQKKTTEEGIEDSDMSMDEELEDMNDTVTDLSDYTSEEVEYARIWLQFSGDDTDDINVSNDGDVVKLKGEDDKISYTSNGNGTINMQDDGETYDVDPLDDEDVVGFLEDTDIN